MATRRCRRRSWRPPATPMAGSSTGSPFYFDLAGAEDYLRAEHLIATAPAVEWVPVHRAAPADVDRDDIERRAAEAGLQPVVWPDPFPFDSREAMLAATYAKQIGRTVAFA